VVWMRQRAGSKTLTQRPLSSFRNSHSPARQTRKGKSHHPHKKSSLTNQQPKQKNKRTTKQPTMTVPQQGSKFDMRTNPVYQVDWMNEASGKRLSASKRKIRFRFGFSDIAALQAGATGPACRGEEHEVLLVWSLTSGKKLVTMDGEEVHFSSSGKITENRFETSWSLGCHTVKIIAHAAPPLFHTPGFKQVDLLIDGLSFFGFTKIFELGTKRGTNSKSMVVRGEESDAAYSNYSLPPSYYQQQSSSTASSFAQRPSLETHRISDSDLSSETSSARIEEESTSRAPAAMVVDILSSPNSSSEQDFFESGPSETSFLSAQADEFTPQIVEPEPQSFSMISNQILSAYAPAPANPSMLALANESHTYGYEAPAPVYTQSQYYNEEPPEQNYYQQPPQQQYAPAAVDSNSHPAPVTPFPHPVTPTMEPLSIGEMEEREAPQELSPLEKAVRSLVHLDDITETVETPEQRKFRQQKMEQQPVHSKPLPPTEANWKLGLQPRLGDIKQTAPPKATPTKEIMRTHAFDPAAVQAGMMVVYGAAEEHPGFGYHHQHQQQEQYYYPPQVGYYQPQQQPQQMY